MTSLRNREQLLGYLVGALEDSERREIDERLEQDLVLREELAEVEELVQPLRSARRRYAPPSGLAARTCRLIDLFSSPTPKERTAAAKRPSRPRARRMTSDTVPPTAAASWNWADVFVASCVAVAVVFLAFPFVHQSRLNSRLVACQDNLRNWGVNLASFHELHPSYLAPVFRAERQRTATIPPALLSKDEAEYLQRARSSLEALPVHRVRSQFSIHPGVGQEYRGQNLLFADGRVGFVATGPAPTRPADWLTKDTPDLASRLNPPSKSGVAAPIVPVSQTWLY